MGMWNSLFQKVLLQDLTPIAFFSCSPVNTLGLIVYEPKEFSCKSTERVSLNGTLKWLEIPRNDKDFLEFLHALLTLLEQPEPPEPSSTCEWCKYRDNSRVTGY